MLSGMLQDHVTSLPLAMVVGLHVACAAALLLVLRTAPQKTPGWRMVGPGGTYWFCFLGTWAFATLVSWVWLFVGSARRDAEEQMGYALLLIAAFGLGAAGTGFYMAALHRMALRWRGTVIRWREKGSVVSQDMADFDAWRRTWSGYMLLRFKGGAVLKLDPHARNAEELAAAISEITGRKIDE
jgi:hypothetical protein